MAVLPSIDQQVAIVLNRNPARQALVQTLRALGAWVSTFDSPQALKINNCAAKVFDVVIAPFADWVGKDMASFRKALAPEGRLINISDVTVTAAGAPGGEHNIDAWLTQPVRQQTLHRVLSKRLEPRTSQLDDNAGGLADMPGMDILPAEDNPINALMAQSLLTRMGHRIVHVENGQRALEELHTGRFDLLLLDLHMPVMDGLTTLEKMGSELDDVAQSPVIVLSTDGQEEVRDTALKLGARDFLVKPIDPHNLQAILLPYTDPHKVSSG